MVFSHEYKLEAFSILQFNPRYSKIEQALDTNDSLKFRLLLEEILDKLEIELRPKIIQDEGSMLVWNSMVNYWFEVNKIYAEFMDEYNKELDQEELKLKGHEIKSN